MGSVNPRSRRTRRHLGRDKTRSVSRADRNIVVWDIQSFFSTPKLGSDHDGDQAAKDIVPSLSVPPKVEAASLNKRRFACESPALDGWRFTQYSQMLSAEPPMGKAVVREKSPVSQYGDPGKYWDDSPLPGELSRDQSVDSKSTLNEQINTDAGPNETYQENCIPFPDLPRTLSQLDDLNSVKTATPSPTIGYPLDRVQSRMSFNTGVDDCQRLADNEKLLTSDSRRHVLSCSLTSAITSKTSITDRQQNRNSSDTYNASEGSIPSERDSNRLEPVSDFDSVYSLKLCSALGMRPNIQESLFSFPYPGTNPQPTPPDSVASAHSDNFYIGCKECLQDDGSKLLPYSEGRLPSNYPLDYVTIPEHPKKDRCSLNQVTDVWKSRHRTFPRHAIKHKSEEGLEALTKFQSFVEGLKGLSDFISARKRELDLARMESMKRTVKRIQELRLDQEREKRHNMEVEMEAYRQRTARVEWARCEGPEQAMALPSQKTDKLVEETQSMMGGQENGCADCASGEGCANCDWEMRMGVEGVALDYKEWLMKKQLASATAWTRL